MKMHKTKFLLAVCGAAVFITDAAQAGRVSKISGQKLGQLCSKASTLGICDAYLAGVVDSEIWAHDYGNLQKIQTPQAFCVPEEAKGQQIRQAVTNWLRVHKEAWQEQAGRAVYRALHQEWPCSPQTEAPSNEFQNF